MMDRKLVIAGILVIALLAGAQATSIDVKVFTASECGPCEKVLEFLGSLKEEYPSLAIEELNTDENSSLALFLDKSSELGFPRVVPITLVGDDYYVGFDNVDMAGKNIRLMIDQADRRQPDEPEGGVTFMLFWSTGCPHCAEERDEFLPYIQEKYPELEILSYNVGEQDSIDVLLRAADELGFSPRAIPISVIGDEYYVGYGSLSTSGKFIEGMVERAYAALEDNQTQINQTQINDTNQTAPSKTIVEIPFIGKVDLEEIMEEMGIPLSTVVLGLLDGFNPCAFFVLTMLLSFLIYAKSRRKMLLIGLTFVFVSGFVYFLFMTMLFSAIRAINEIRIMAFVGGIIALSIGFINVKDFFFFKKGISLTISEDKKPKLYKRMRNILKSQTTIELLIGTIILAFIANSYELLCTLGLPIVYGNLLDAQQLGMFTSVMYVVLYNIFYILPLLIIVLMFVRSLGGKKMSEETGETLKAISGFMMLGFGVLLLTDPMILSNIFVTASLIGFAIIISLVLSKIKKRYKGKPEKGSGKESEGKGDEDGTSEESEVQ